MARIIQVNTVYNLYYTSRQNANLHFQLPCSLSGLYVEALLQSLQYFGMDQLDCMFFKWASPASYFRIFHMTIQILIEKSIDGVFRTRTRRGRMEGANKSSELRRYPQPDYMFVRWAIKFFKTRKNEPLQTIENEFSVQE